MKITIEVEKFVDEDHNEVTDGKEIAKLIRKHISHLGKFTIY